jgi:hypothetical protein
MDPNWGSNRVYTQHSVVIRARCDAHELGYTISRFGVAMWGEDVFSVVGAILVVLSDECEGTAGVVGCGWVEVRETAGGAVR